MLLKQRRKLMWLYLTASLVLLFAYVLYARLEFVDLAFDSGVFLTFLMLILTSYNLKKKISFIPIGASRTWTQVHIYVGIFSFFLFLVHTSFKIPSGALEVLLAILYGLTFLTGIIGLFITRVFPNRLTARGDEVVFENIPIERQLIKEEVETIIINVAKKSKSEHLIKFYKEELSDYFSAPSHLVSHLFESRRPLRVLNDKVNDLKRYCNKDEIACLDKLNELIIAKGHLDYHNSLQGTLKLWLFVHIPLAYSMLIFALLHILMVFYFRGRIPS